MTCWMTLQSISNYFVKFKKTQSLFKALFDWTTLHLLQYGLIIYSFVAKIRAELYFNNEESKQIDPKQFYGYRPLLALMTNTQNIASLT